MKMRRILATMMAVLMLLSLIPTASAEFVRPHKHLYLLQISRKEPTCLEPGEVVKGCSCGATKTTYLDMLEHDWTEWKIVLKPTDCISWDGLKEKTCKACGETAQDEVSGDHKWSSWKTTKEATCTESGKREHKCVYCDKKETEKIPAGAHKWGDWVIIQEADPNGQVGIRERKCSRCGKIERVEFYPEGTHKRGDKDDEEVERIQEELNEDGYDCGKPDGDFGPNTENAWKKWQEANGYTPDGIMWPGQIEEILDDDEPSAEYVTSLDLELLDELGASYAKVGDLFAVNLKITNNGDVTLTANCYGMYLPEGGSDMIGTFEGIFDTADARWDYFRAGESDEFIYNIYVREEDLAAGELRRTATYYALPWYHGIDQTRTDIPVVEAVEYPEGANFKYAREDKEISDSVEIVIPLIPGNSGEVDSDAVLEKCLYNMPANGEYYVVGETIEYVIYFHNLRNHELVDVEVSDPLKGGNEDAVLTIEPAVDPLGQLQAHFSYTVTEEDAAVGSVTNTATASWWNTETEERKSCESNTLVTPVGYGDGVGGPLVLTKSVVSTPANGKHYVPGETISYEVAIENVSSETLYDVIVYDPILEFAELKPYDTVEPGFTDVIGFSYVVTEADAAAGFVENTAFVMHYADGEFQDRIWSNTVSVPCGNKQLINLVYVLTGYTEVVKSVVSTPANGLFYVPGETVTFRIDVTNLHPTMAMLDVVVTDPLMTEYGGAWECMSLDPGATESFIFDYVVTPIDAIAGSVSNVASVESFLATGDPTNPKGEKCVGVSNTVVVPTGSESDVPFGVITDLEIIKEEISMPANGAYYTEGETIAYKITYTNIGETKLDETIIYDTLAIGGDIAYAEMLDVGESRYCTFNYVVTAEDVAQGYVVNTAIAQFGYNGYANTVTSEPVVSDTDGDPNTTYVPEDGKIDWEELRGTETDEDGNALPAEDTCYLKPVVRDGEVVEYEAHFCTKHAATHNAILTMAQSMDDAYMQMVWEYAYAMWQKDVDAMYEEILAVCDDDAKITVMSERVSNLAMIANTQFALKIVEPDQAAETAHAVADLWQYKCIDLCYLMNTAPAARADSIFSIERGVSDVVAGEGCTCVVSEETEDKILFADHYCAVHSFAYEMTEILLMAGNDEETWATVRSMWEVELNSAYNALYASASEAGGMAYLVEYSAYLNWLTAQEAFMNAAYPQKPEIVAEVMVNIIMERTQEVCERMK